MEFADSRWSARYFALRPNAAIEVGCSHSGRMVAYSSLNRIGEGLPVILPPLPDSHEAYVPGGRLTLAARSGLK